MINIEECRKLQREAYKVLHDMMGPLQARRRLVHEGDDSLYIAIDLLGVLIERIAKETPQELARVLGRVLAEDNWGDIDPYWIERAGALGIWDSEDRESSHYNEVEALRTVFKRVVAHFNGDSIDAV